MVPALARLLRRLARHGPTVFPSGLSAKVEALAAAGPRRAKLAAVLLLGLGAAAVGAGALRQPAQAVPQRPQAGKDLHGDPMPPGVLARLGTARLRHAGVRALAFAADGRTLTTVGEGEVRCVWDVASGRLARQLPGPRLNYSDGAVACAGDGSVVVAWHFEDPAHFSFWDAASGKRLRTILWPHGWPRLLFLSPNGRAFAATRQQKLHLLDPTTGNERLPPIRLDRDDGGAAFSPDGQRLATISGGHGWGHLRLWDTATSKELWRSRAVGQTVTFAPGGRVLASTGWGQGVTLWDVATGALKTTLPLPPRWPF